MKRIVLDPTKCVGCRTCELICSLVNEGEANPARSRILVVRTVRDRLLYATPVFCQQCEEPYCLAVCPVHAITEDSNGIKIVDERRCIGCRLCETACPVGAIRVDPERQVAIKCDLCKAAGSEPQCVAHCYHDAIDLLPVEKAGMARARAKTEAYLNMVAGD